MNEEEIISRAILEIMSDRRSRSAKQIARELGRKDMVSTAPKVARICSRIPEIETIGKWNHRSEYKMVG